MCFFINGRKMRREKMKLTWLNNKFICKDLYAPFKIGKDSDYLNDLKNKYDIVIDQAKNSGADDESLRIIADFSARILKSLELYYKADIAESNNIILELVKDIGNNPFAVNSVINSDAFPGIKTNELQFFRSRLGSPNKAFKDGCSRARPRGRKRCWARWRPFSGHGCFPAVWTWGSCSSACR